MPSHARFCELQITPAALSALGSCSKEQHYSFWAAPGKVSIFGTNTTDQEHGNDS